MQLLCEAITVPGPLKCESSEDRSHGVIGMSRDASFWAKGEHDVRTELSDVKNQSKGYTVEILAMQVSIGIVEHNATRHLEYFA